jgi:hypothetical protein
MAQLALYDLAAPLPSSLSSGDCAQYFRSVIHAISEEAPGMQGISKGIGSSTFLAGKLTRLSKICSRELERFSRYCLWFEARISFTSTS